MKAKLIFDLPEDKDEFTTATRGLDYFLALNDVDNFLRATARGKNSVIEDASCIDEIVDIIQNRFYEILDFYKIRMDEIS